MLRVLLHRDTSKSVNCTYYKLLFDLQLNQDKHGLDMIVEKNVFAKIKITLQIIIYKILTIWTMVSDYFMFWSRNYLNTKNIILNKLIETKKNFNKLSKYGHIHLVREY